jgi:hypothetical protein
LFSLENLHAAVTWYLVGLIWLVQLVQYPMFAYLDRAQFVEAHAFHSSAIGIVVGPPMLAEIALAAWMVFQGARGPLAWVGLGLVLVIWASTFFIIVPMHAQLGSAGFDAGVHGRMVAWNWIRTVAWSLRGVIALVWVRAT